MSANRLMQPKTCQKAKKFHFEQLTKILFYQDPEYREKISFRF